MKIQVVLFQGEDRGLVPVTAPEFLGPLLKKPLGPSKFGVYFLPATAFLALRQELPRRDFRGHQTHLPHTLFLLFCPVSTFINLEPLTPPPLVRRGWGRGNKATKSGIYFIPTLTLPHHGGGKSQDTYESYICDLTLLPGLPLPAGGLQVKDHRHHQQGEGGGGEEPEDEGPG
jgi:hypothetical protein